MGRELRLTMPTLCAIPRGNRQFYLFGNPLSPNLLSVVYWLFLLFSSVAFSPSSTAIAGSFSRRFFVVVFEYKIDCVRAHECISVCVCECELWTMQCVVAVSNVFQSQTFTAALAHVCASINGTRGYFKCWVNFFTALQARTWFYYIFHSWQF